jgi:hypothetical protein
MYGRATDAMAVSSTSINVASMTDAAMSQGFTPWAACADWSGGAVAVAAMLRGELLQVRVKQNVKI